MPRTLTGSLEVDTTEAGTPASTTETTLWDWDLPANTLSTDGDTVRITVWGRNTGGGTVRLYFGSTVVSSRVVQGTWSWQCEAVVSRMSGTTQQAVAVSNTSTTGSAATQSEPGQTLSSAVTIKVTGQNSAATANLIVFEGAVVESVRSDGMFWLTTAATNLLAAGGTTSSFPALKRSGTTLQVRLADDSANTDVEAATVLASRAELASTAADALEVAGGITAGSGSVGIVNTSGKIPGLTSTYVASLDGAALTNLDAGNLASGTVPDARFPATLPAVSGANLTSLNGSSISSGTVAPARLGSGTPSSSTFLRGDGTWQEVSSIMSVKSVQRLDVTITSLGSGPGNEGFSLGTSLTDYTKAAIVSVTPTAMPNSQLRFVITGSSTVTAYYDASGPNVDGSVFSLYIVEFKNVG